MNDSQDNTNSHRKDVISHTFVIILNTIKLDVSWPVQLIIKFDNGLLSRETYSTHKPIQIYPKECQDHEIEDGYKEYEVMMEQTEMKIALNANPLKI